MDNYTTDEPIYALATAYQKSALAVIRLSGEKTFKLLSPFFSRPKKLINAKTNTAIYGKIIDQNGSTVDEVILVCYEKGHGYTSEEAVEIMAHGSLSGLKRIFLLLEEAGFRQAKKGEFTFRAFCNGKLDLTQAEAVEEIISAKSRTSQQRALDRLEGKLKKELEEISNQILFILASLEVQLDYAEDEILEDWIYPKEEIDSIIKKLKKIIGTYDASRLYKDGAKVVLAGSTNAGKSSLFNLLIKENRAIVSDVPGTTRDYIETWLTINDIPIRLFDTAGLRESNDIIESEGIKRSEDLINDADLVVYLVDPTDPILPDEISENTILVYSKSDILENKDKISISTLSREGIEDLLSEITARLTKDISYDNSEIAIESERQKEKMENLLQILEETKMLEGGAVDIMAINFQAALREIGEITGEITNDDILDTLFSSFCVGK